MVDSRSLSKFSGPWGHLLSFLQQHFLIRTPNTITPTKVPKPIANLVVWPIFVVVVLVLVLMLVLVLDCVILSKGEKGF